MRDAAVRTSILLCPACQMTSEELMPLDACVYFWTCPHCSELHRPKAGDCCVFCSYGSIPCPPVQQAVPVRCADPRVLQALQAIPGVGKSVSLDLWNLGIRSIEDLRGQDAQELYDRLCTMQQAKIDRCMLYTLRCAVYFASTEERDPELLKWWNWKNRNASG